MSINRYARVKVIGWMIKVNKQGWCLFTFLQQQTISIWIENEIEILQ